MNFDERRRGLLGLIAADQEQKLAALRTDAETRARELIAAARRAGRTQLRAAVAAEQRALAAHAAAAAAHLQNVQRQRAQGAAAAELAWAWAELPGALAARWAEPSTRSTWAGSAAAAARRLLPAGSWEVHHPAEWPEPERRAWATQLGAGLSLRFIADAGISAGLVIRAGHNVVDGSLAGLLADRNAVAQQLRAALEVTP